MSVNPLTKAIEDILDERQRQDERWGTPQFRPNAPWGLILMEEVGEVSRAILERKPMGELRKELVQVAAVAVAWLEAIAWLEKIEGES